MSKRRKKTAKQRAHARAGATRVRKRVQPTERVHKRCRFPCACVRARARAQILPHGCARPRVFTRSNEDAQLWRTSSSVTRLGRDVAMAGGLKASNGSARARSWCSLLLWQRERRSACTGRESSGDPSEARGEKARRMLLGLLLLALCAGDVMVKRVSLRADDSGQLHVLLCDHDLRVLRKRSAQRAVVREATRTIALGADGHGGAVLVVFDGERQSRCLHLARTQPVGLMWDSIAHHDTPVLVLRLPDARALLTVARYNITAGQLDAQTQLDARGESTLFVGGNYAALADGGPMLQVLAWGHPVVDAVPLSCVGPQPFRFEVALSANLSAWLHWCADVACAPHLPCHAMPPVRGVPPLIRPSGWPAILASVFMLGVLVVSYAITAC